MKTLLLCLIAASAIAMPRIRVTTYAKSYSDAAYAHHNSRYHPDSMNVAVGWRYLKGRTLWIYRHAQTTFDFDDSATRVTAWRVRVVAKDVMNKRYDSDTVLRLDCSPRVMRALQLDGAAWIDSVHVIAQ